jgi:hypothetical protein
MTRDRSVALAITATVCVVILVYVVVIARTPRGSPSPGGALGKASSTHESAASNGRSEVMQITFKRSGGVAGMPGLDVEATIDLLAHPAVVTSGAYRRPLAATEIPLLRVAAELLRTAETRRALAALPGTLNDAYHYEIALVTSDGTTHRVALNAADGGQAIDGALSGVGALVRWIDGEVQKIREQRLKSR